MPARLQVCAIINLAVIPFTEGLAPFYDALRVGPLILLSNAAIAFLLNVAAVFLVGVGSGLILTLAGVFKVCAPCPALSPIFSFSSSFYLRIISHLNGVLAPLIPAFHRANPRSSPFLFFETYFSHAGLHLPPLSFVLLTQPTQLDLLLTPRPAVAHRTSSS